jgi:hypothetical protein
MATDHLAQACDSGLHGDSHYPTVRHGTRCECVALAAALGLPPGAISFYYCRNMLQRRWAMTCKHGQVEEAGEQPSAYEKWKDKGDMNPVLAILVENT